MSHSYSCHVKVVSMVPILDGNSEIGAHVRSNLYYSICLSHFIDREQSKIWNFFLQRKPIFLHAGAKCSAFQYKDHGENHRDHSILLPKSLYSRAGSQKKEAIFFSYLNFAPLFV